MNKNKVEEMKLFAKIEKLREINAELLVICKCALADLQGIMPEFEPDGDRKHPAWRTIKELKKYITKTENK